MVARSKKKPKKMRTSRTFFVILLVVVVFCIAALVKSINKNRQINAEIQELRNQMYTLEKETVEMDQLIEYFNSTAFIEEKARVDLGLKKPGEKVVVVPEFSASTTLNPTQEQEEAPPEAKKRNIEKWWVYLFK